MSDDGEQLLARLLLEILKELQAVRHQLETEQQILEAAISIFDKESDGTE